MTFFKDRPEPFGRLSELAISPLKYYELGTQINILAHNELSAALQTLSEKLRERGEFVPFVLVTTGSDGRQEAGSIASQYEGLIMVIDGTIDLEHFERVVASIAQELAPNRVGLYETKGPRTRLSFYKDDPKRVQIGRVADARLFVGDNQILQDAKQRLGEEIVAMSGNTVDRVYDMVRSARRVTQEHKNVLGGKEAVHFDPIQRKAYFNPAANQLSFKIGPLRLVQNTLIAEAVRHTRRENDPGFIRSLHAGIVNRLTQLSDDRRITLEPASVRELEEHYAFFLRLYHLSEQQYVRSMQSEDPAIQALAFERTLTESENEEVAKRLIALQELTRALKIQSPKG